MPAAHSQAELNSNLHEQVILLREQKELSEARAEKSAAEVKKLTAKVRGRAGWAGRTRIGRRARSSGHPMKRGSDAARRAAALCLCCTCWLLPVLCSVTLQVTTFREGSERMARLPLRFARSLLATLYCLLSLPFLAGEEAGARAGRGGAQGCGGRGAAQVPSQHHPGALATSLPSLLTCCSQHAIS